MAPEMRGCEPGRTNGVCRVEHSTELRDLPTAPNPQQPCSDTPGPLPPGLASLRLAGRSLGTVVT